MNPAKASVRRAFSGAVDSYDVTADFQRQVGLRLLTGLPSIPSPSCVVDLGCGTGHGTGLLAARWPLAQLVGVDFALPLLRCVPATTQTMRLCADAESLPLRDHTADLLWSNLTLQWCDAARFFAEASRLLRPGGLFALTTLGSGTFAELRRAFAAADGYRHTINFHDETTLTALLSAAGWHLRSLQRVMLTRHHADIRQLLAEVRDIGANRVGSGQRRGLMGKAEWRRFEQAYERQRGDDGLPLSYDTLFIYAER